MTKEFDFGVEQNKKVYGQEIPPMIDFNKVKDSKVPIAMYYAKHDLIVTPEDSIKAKQMLGDTIVDFQVIEGGHMAFFVNRDQSYFQKNAMDLIKKYNKI